MVFAIAFYVAPLGVADGVSDNYTELSVDIDSNQLHSLDAEKGGENIGFYLNDGHTATTFTVLQYAELTGTPTMPVLYWAYVDKYPDIIPQAWQGYQPEHNRPPGNLRV